MTMTSKLSRLALALAACGPKGPAAELKSAEDAIAAAKAAQVDAANADLTQAEATLAKAKAEIDTQSNYAVKDFTTAKQLLAEAKSLAEKALAAKAGTAGEPAKLKPKS